MVSVYIDGIKYLGSTEIIKQLSVSRQTFWRWRQAGKIPLGHRFRDGRIFYTEEELQKILKYANKIESLEPPLPKQLKLFDDF